VADAAITFGWPLPLPYAQVAVGPQCWCPLLSLVMVYTTVL
jgi:hypothetical protein